jgi:hypothetical protein
MVLLGAQNKTTKSTLGNQNLQLPRLRHLIGLLKTGKSMFFIGAASASSKPWRGQQAVVLIRIIASKNA